MISPPDRAPVSFSDASLCASLRARAVSPIRLISIVLLFACKFVAMLRMLFLFWFWFLFDTLAKDFLTVSSRRVRELCNSPHLISMRESGLQWAVNETVRYFCNCEIVFHPRETFVYARYFYIREILLYLQPMYLTK